MGDLRGEGREFQEERSCQQWRNSARTACDVRNA